VYKPGGEKKGETQGPADGIALPPGLHDPQEIRDRLHAEVGAPKAPNVKIGGVKTAMSL
jgi:hypothetical protein